MICVVIFSIIQNMQKEFNIFFFLESPTTFSVIVFKKIIEGKVFFLEASNKNLLTPERAEQH